MNRPIHFEIQAENTERAMAAVNAYVCTAGVEDLDAMVVKAVAAGGSIAVPKMPIPTMGWLAYCKDTEGNLFGMMQMESNAA